MAERYWRLGFRDFKVKLSADAARDRENLAVFATWATWATRGDGSLSVRADANNLWPNADAGIAGISVLGYPFFAIEEPIAKDQIDQLSRVSLALGCPIVLDESCARLEQVARLTEPVSQWLINVRVSKMGGLIRALQVIDAARARGITIIVGAQVGETSVLTRAQLTAARAAGEALVAQEGAFGTFLLERDVCDPPLMFGAGGVLAASDHQMLTRPGLGVDTSRFFEDVGS
jgi:L-alanine-DL-glutamate epimerase-like enolase superfamily enzyme